MVDHSEMPSALQVAQAVSAGSGQEARRSGASEIVLTREEAALCLGLAEGVAENLDRASRTPAERSPCLAPSGR
jgi:hypothetical protein